MATFTNGDSYSAETAADLSTKQYYICKLDTNGKAVLAAAATDAIFGILHDGGRKSGDTADIKLINGQGTFKVKVGASGISKGDFLTSDSNGKAVATTTPGDRVFGRALHDAAAGEIAEYLKCNEEYV